ncbi:MAG: AAA family ATPase [Muribaculaceae bacterium]|nr:AAA family ATPase [Muribaculaceae bacterium]
MITKKDIEDFFDLEAEESKKRWEAAMKLSVNERVRKRKAIKSVYLDKEFGGHSEENYRLLRVTVGINLADFKEGECLILHKEDSVSGIPCTLNKFEGDEAIILEVFPPNMPSSLDLYYDQPLILDKDKVDLRDKVFRPFICHLPNSSDSFWEETIINKFNDPEFDNEDKCESFLSETEEYFKLKLLPKQREAIKNSMLAKDYYMIQGPPGTGKSFVLGVIMLEEIYDLHHNVIVIGPNHLAINNAIYQLVRLRPSSIGSMIKVGQSYNAPSIKIERDGEIHKIINIPYLNVFKLKEILRKKNGNCLIGLTPHALYTSRARGLECDTLIIDEAGQMTIPLALMGMIKAKKVIFAGDHKQLPPIVSSDKIRAEMKQSAFQRLITENNCTMLDTSFRMCEPICRFVSDLFYDGRLKAMKSGHGTALICENPLYSFDTPVVLHEVVDEGEQASDEEARFIADTIVEFIKRGIPAKEIAVLSPFRAQATNVRRNIRRHPDIDEDSKQEVTSDTIDKMQGQEREVIIYSLVSGNTDYMTEMAEFLYNPNKMNVAFSRAKSKLIIVGSLSKIENLNLPDYPHIKRMMESPYAVKL